MSDYIREKLALDAVKEMHTHFYSADDAIDGKALGLLSSSSLILTLFGILQLNSHLEDQTTLYYIGLGSIVFFYLLLVGTVMKIIVPKDYRLVFEASWEGMEKAVLHQTDSDAYYQLISNYLARIKNNKKISQNKALWLRITAGIFIVIIVLMVALSICAAL